MTMGLATITSFLQYWADDVLGGPHARTLLLNTPFSGEQFVGTLFMPITMLMFLPTCLLAGGASDRWGRKRLVYVSGAMMTIGGAVLQLLHTLPNHLNYTGLFSVTTICFALGTVMIRQVKGAR
jgi:MFS family permease